MPEKIDVRSCLPAGKAGILDVRKKNKALNLKSRIHNLKPAFTLIELLVVIGILAVLSSAVIISTNNARERGKDSRRKQDLQAINTALIAYYADNKQYPPPNPATNPQRDFSSALIANWIPDLATYLNKIPKDPLQSQVTNYFAEAFGGLGRLAATFSQPRTIAKNGQVSGVVTENFGNSTGFSNTDQYNSGNLQGNKFTMGANSGTTNTTNAMYVYIGTSGGSSINATAPNNKFKLVIYNDNGGNPSTPVANANGEGTITTTIAGWRSVNFSSAVTLNANTDYWLFYTSNSGSNLINNANWEPSTLTSGFQTFPYTDPFPSNFTPQPEVNRTYAIYVPYSYDTSSGTVTSSINASGDDGKYISAGPDAGTFGAGITDVPVGNPFGTGCPDTRNSFMVFRNINIPAGKTISSATLTFSMRNAVPPASTPESDAYYDGRTPIKTKFFAIKTLTPGTPANASEWTTEINKAHTAEVVADDIAAWIPPGTASFDITSIFSDPTNGLYNLPNWAGTSRNVLLFWVDNGTTIGSCAGRMGVSYDGSPGYGNPPKLDISYANTPLPPACTSTTAQVGTSVSLSATGGDGIAANYSWSFTGTAPNPPDQTGNPISVTFTSTGTKTVNVTNNGQGQCTVTVSATVSNIGGSSSNNYATTRGDCDASTNTYCLRVSNNLRAYVLWTTLENINDPEIFTTSDSKCNSSDTDWANYTSPYFHLNLKSDNTTSLNFNYCIKSPPL